MNLDTQAVSKRSEDIANRVEQFIRQTIVPFENDPRRTAHGPEESLVEELQDLARESNVLTPHVLDDGSFLTHRETAAVFRKTGLSPLGPIACNTAAPDEGNMYLLHKVANSALKSRFLEPLLTAKARSAFFMTEPAEDGGAGSDPSMLKSTAKPEGDYWLINGRKTFITGVTSARIGIIMAKSDEGASMFLVDLPDPAIRVERMLDTIDNSAVGGHALVSIENLRVPAEQMLGESGSGFRYAQLRLGPARLTHCMRWLGACTRAQEIATQYAVARQAFGKPLIDHEGVGFKLAKNLIALKQCELMIDWVAGVLDAGSPAITESSMAKAAIAESLFSVADRCVQVMGGLGVSGDTVVEQVFRELRAFRIYDGPTEVHLWALAKKIKREFSA